MKMITNSKQGTILRLVTESSALMYRSLLILFISTCFCFVSEAKNYPVSSALELSNITSSLQPGDTVKLSSGTWTDQELVFKGTGTSSQPIVLTTAVRNAVVLTGSSRLKIYGEYLTVNGLRFENGYRQSGAVVEFRNGSSELAKNCRLTNTTILNYNPSNKDTDYKWVSVYGSRNRVDHCHFEGKEHSGTTLVVWLNGEPNYTQIDHNYFGSRPDLGYNGGETIRIGTSTNSMQESRAIVEYNLFEECDGEIEIISNKSCFNVYRYNTFRNNDGCLTLRHGNDCEVYSNYFIGEDKSSGGVRIIGERHKVYNNYFEGLKGDDYRSAICLMNGVPDSPLNRYFQVIDAEVTFNTIVDCKMPIIIGAGKDSEKTLAPLNCVIANNAIDKTSGSKNITIEDEPTNMQWEGNVVNADENDEPISEGVSYTDPLFENKQYMWRPTSTSPLLGSAEGTYSYVSEDIENDERSEPKAIGCDDGVANTDWSPLQKDDVGPYSDDDTETGIASVVKVSDMIQVVKQDDTYTFKVKDQRYLPINFMISDINGKLIQKGMLYDEYRFIAPKSLVCIAVFQSGNKYVQPYKLLSLKSSFFSN